MRLAINQPYFFPYIGYFQLIAAVDEFIVYDNIKYTKKGWINRNRFLRNEEAADFALPLSAAPDHLDIGQRVLAGDFSERRLLNQIHGAYRKAPCFDKAMNLIMEIMSCPDRNLFGFLLNSLRRTCDYLQIQTPVLVSSSIAIDHRLKSESKVLALCQARNADSYINAIGGTELYSRERFAEQQIKLFFLRPLPTSYLQFGNAFVPWLSIIDIIMFNEVAHIRTHMLPDYELI